LKVGWVYAVSSFFTLFIINGILAFMLTPGDAWVAVAGSKQEATRFWQAFFNPTFWPNLLMRTLVCLSLAGVWALVTCSRIDQERSPELKAGLVRWSAQWLIPVFILLPLAAAWYVASVPEGSRALMRLGVSTVGAGTFAQVTRIATMVLISSVVVVGVVYLFAWRSPQDLRFSQALTVVFLALIATGSGEYTREMLRKPFVIGRHMYSNGLRVADTARANQDGYLGKSLWRGGDKSSMSNAGQAMFRGQCMSCHTLDGYRSMRRLLAGRNREAIGSLLKILHEHKPDSPYRAYMPPLVGTESEISALGDYLAALTSSNAPAAQTNRNASAVR
jgi:mono/diheme cytochrome c family protein